MRKFLYILFAGCIGISAYAAWFFFAASEEDRMAYEIVRFNKQLEALKREATGDPRAYLKIADLYATAESGFLNDPAAAVDYIERGARAGDPEAQYQLAKVYMEGEFRRHSLSDAAKWFRVAAVVSGHPEANFALGELYYTGRGVAHDYAQALDFYLRAAERGHPVAQHLAAEIYAEGWGVRADGAEALKWAILASAQEERVSGHSSRFDPKGLRDKLEGRLNRTQIREATEQAAAFKPVR